MKHSYKDFASYIESSYIVYVYNSIITSIYLTPYLQLENNSSTGFDIKSMFYISEHSYNTQ